MDPERKILKELEPTERLPIDSRNELQRLVWADEYGFDDAQALAWVKKNAKIMARIIDNDELIKAEVREGNLAYAAGMVKERLDEEIGVNET